MKDELSTNKFYVYVYYYILLKIKIKQQKQDIQPIIDSNATLL